jgi:hypothetical protein
MSIRLLTYTRGKLDATEDEESLTISSEDREKTAIQSGL